MKKIIALLAALALLVLCAAAFAEETENYAPEESVGMFDSMWVSDFGEIRAFSMDGYWVVEITARDQTKEWDYLCVYDAEKKALDETVERINRYRRRRSLLFAVIISVIIILGALYYYLPWIAEKLGIG